MKQNNKQENWEKEFNKKFDKYYIEAIINDECTNLKGVKQFIQATLKNQEERLYKLEEIRCQEAVQAEREKVISEIQTYIAALSITILRKTGKDWRNPDDLKPMKMEFYNYLAKLKK